MAIQAKFELGVFKEVDGKETFIPTTSLKWDLSGFRILTGRKDDASSPTTPVQLDYVELEISSPSNAVRHLLQWHLENGLEQGRVSMELVTVKGKQITRVIDLANAQCFNVKEDYNTTTRSQSFKFQIVAESITIDGKKITRIS